jgi:transposase
MSSNGKRLNWSAADKVRIVLAGMQFGIEVSELCRREGLNSVFDDAWKKQLLGSTSRVLKDRKARLDARQERLEAKNARFKSVIVEITAENLELRKGLSD